MKAKSRLIQATSTIILALLSCELGRPDPLDTWRSSKALPSDRPLHGVVWGAGQFVAVGDAGTILTSADGVNWVLQQSGTNDSLTNRLNSVAFGNGQFIAVSQGGAILSSTDGQDWVIRQAGSQSALLGVGFGEGVFVAVGQVILTSTDGVNWVSSQAPDVGLRGVCYGGGLFIAVGDGGSVLTSADGTNWVQHQSATQNSLRGVAYGNGQFVAVGWGNRYDPTVIVTSTDGVNWVPGLDAGGVLLSSISYGNDQFVAVGGYWSFDIGPSILTSAAGASWTIRSQGDGAYNLNLGLWGIAYGNRSFVAVGGAPGTVLRSGGFYTLALIPQSDRRHLGLALEGPIGLAYTIEQSADLASWQTLTNITTTEPISIVSEVVPAASEHLFYRALSQ